MTPRLEEGQAEQASVGATKEYTSLGDRGENDSKTDEKVPWHRTTKGIIILTVLALVVIGAAVGGGVGGALSGKSNNKNNNNGKSGAGIAPSQTTPTGSPETNQTITTTTSSQHTTTLETSSTSPQVSVSFPSTGSQTAPIGSGNPRRRGPAAPAPSLLVYH